jgi:hypothetical protein
VTYLRGLPKGRTSGTLRIYSGDRRGARKNRMVQEDFETIF